MIKKNNYNFKVLNGLQTSSNTIYLQNLVKIKVSGFFSGII